MLTFLGSVTWHTLGLGWGGWGDVNVPWKRYVTYAGVGVGGGVMLTFLGSVTWHTLGLGWGGWGDANVPWKRYVTYAGVGVGGWGDVHVRVNLHAFCTLCGSRCLGWVWGGAVMLTFVLTCTLSAHYIDNRVRVFSRIWGGLTPHRRTDFLARTSFDFDERLLLTTPSFSTEQLLETSESRDPDFLGSLSAQNPGA